MAELEINEQMQVRINKMKELEEKGIDPFGHRFERTHTSQQIVDNFESLEGTEATVAGRVMAIRGHGKASFVVLADNEGQIQIYIRMDEVLSLIHIWYNQRYRFCY